MRLKRKSKRLGLPPGFISLALLPVILFLYLNQNGVFKKEYCIQMTFPVPETEDDELNNLRFTESGFMAARKNWDTSLVLTADKKKNQEIIAEFRNKLQALRDTKDTLQGIGIKYHEKTSFSEFVTLVDICLSDSILSFMGVSKGFYAFHNEKSYENKKENLAWTCGTGGDILINEQEERERAFEEWLNKEKINNQFKYKQWPLLALFILLAILAVRKLYKAHI
jgi:hypothetical protein